MTERSDSMTRGTLGLLLRAGAITAAVDGLFASTLSVAFYGSTVSRLFQGVAATLLGQEAIGGGDVVTWLGIGMHVGVAFAWSTVWLAIVTHSNRVRQTVSTPGGVLRTAAVFGPCVWLVMSLLVIPALTHRPTAFTVRWWVQLIGHAPFVGLPIVGSIAWPLRRGARTRAFAGVELPAER